MLVSMYLASGWPIIWRNDQIAQLGIDPDTRLVWADASGIYYRLLRLLEHGISRAGFFAEVKREKCSVAMGEELLRTLQKAGAILDKPSTLLPVSETVKSLMRSAGMTKLELDTTINFDFISSDLWVNSESSPLLTGLQYHLGRLGVQKLYQWQGEIPCARSGVVIDVGGPLVDPTKYDVIIHNDVTYLPISILAPWRVEVGPLVIPGKGSCKRCETIQRTAVDQHWFATLVQAQNLPCPQLLENIVLPVTNLIVYLIWQLQWGNPILNTMFVCSVFGQQTWQVLPHRKCGCVEQQ